MVARIFDRRIRCCTAMLAVVACTACVWLPPERERDLTGWLRRQTARFGPLLESAREYRLQILISEVVDDRRGFPSLRTWSFRPGAEYFYPASAVKLCAAVSALQAIEALQRAHASGDLLRVPLEIAPLFPGDVAQRSDPSNAEGQRITVGHEIRKLALVSDNQAFNRLFDLVGHEQLHRSMQELGLNSPVLNHRLSESRVIPQPLNSAAVTLRLSDSASVEVPARVGLLARTNRAPRIQVGAGFLRGDKTVLEPMDFTRRNGISLRDLQHLLVKVVRPDIDLGTPGCGLTDSHRDFLVQALTQYPRESRNPVYPGERFPDDYCKYLLPGIRRVFPSVVESERIQVTGKIGQAYGFTVENSYLRNPANGRAVFVTAVIYTNRDEILNDDRYEYETVAAPFFANLGECVARRWLK
ncbi:MAG: serine hydrolase [Verrucomicrobiales bacterium]|nr:serine hydrolase [Verrucomicrobiales bacterium]